MVETRRPVDVPASDRVVPRIHHPPSGLALEDTEEGLELDDLESDPLQVHRRIFSEIATLGANGSSW